MQKCVKSADPPSTADLREMTKEEVRTGRNIAAITWQDHCCNDLSLQVRALEGEKDVDSSQEEGGSTPAPAKEEIQGELASSRWRN